MNLLSIKLKYSLDSYENNFLFSKYLFKLFKLYIYNITGILK